MSLSVAMVLQSFHPAVGGAERQALELSRALGRRGARCRVLTRRLRGLPSRDEVDGIPVVRLTGGEGPAGSAAFAVASLLHLLAHGREYDVIHAHLLASHAVAAAAAGRLLGKRVIVKLGGGAGYGEIAGANRGGTAALKIRAIRALRPALVVVNVDQRREAAEAGLSELVAALVPNGVDLAAFRPASPQERDAVRARRGWSGVVFLFTGRFGADKGQVEALRVLLRALREASRSAPDATLRLVGEGPAEAAFRGAVRESGVEALVRFEPPARSRGEIAEVYRGADAFVLPTRSEGVSNALLEAMASGLPVIVPRVSGIEGLVEDGREGLLYGPEDADTAAAGLRRIAGDPALRREAGRRARERAETHSIDRVAERYLELYAPPGTAS